MASRLSVYWPGPGLGVGDNVFGMSVANFGLLRAVARHGGFEQIDVLSNGEMTDDALVEGLLEGDHADTRLRAGSILDVSRPAASGTLLRGTPDLGDLAWLRHQLVGDRSYSLVGLVHSLAPPAVRQNMGAASVAPIQPWDAMICTSPSVQQALGCMFDEWDEYLAERFGGRKPPRPQLPLVPLGVDQAAIQALADRPGVRAELRDELGLAADDILVLWVGRLSFFEKAFPQPMFRAVEEAGRAVGRRVHFALAGWFPTGADGRAQYEQAARAHAPSTPIHFIDGNDRQRLGALWAAADVFLSLVDNIQETFGITPIEAMSAGLPVVVSDWDGYRYTVRDGEQGFLIPTLLGPPGQLGRSMIARHTLRIDSYQAYAGSVAQHTAVHVGRAAGALAALIRSPELRRRMGEAGRARVKEAFDWPVIAGQVNELIDDLSAIRARAGDPSGRRRINPLKGDPFQDFVGFATEQMSEETRLSVRAGVGAAELARMGTIDLDRAFAAWRMPPADCRAILAMIAGGDALTVGDVVARFPKPRRHFVELTIVWMAKHGLIDWLPPAG
ncbi:glycosyltransferase family 4 protein [Thalassobaculum sp.]|uniref:glycosyltransferase family 4 protein n=1 Tax=Thalassobaculum sp. TaxID=2022740 RepID=UPI0032EB2C61